MRVCVSNLHGCFQTLLRLPLLLVNSRAHDCAVMTCFADVWVTNRRALCPPCPCFARFDRLQRLLVGCLFGRLFGCLFGWLFGCLFVCLFAVFVCCVCLLLCSQRGSCLLSTGGRPGQNLCVHCISCSQRRMNMYSILEYCSAAVQIQNKLLIKELALFSSLEVFC